MRTWAALILLMGVLALLPVAAAHATPVKTFPKQGERLDASPTEVWADFSEKLEGDTRLSVLDASKAHVEHGATELSGKHASVRVEALPDGGYLVEWHTLSAVDGHEASGAWGFAVGNATVPATPAVAEPPLKPGAVIGKAVAFIGLALLVGALAFRLVIHPQDPLGLERWGAATHLLGLVVFSMVQGGAAPTALADYLSTTEYGRGLLIRLLLGLAFLALTLPVRLADARGAQFLRALLALALVTAYAAAGHVAAYAGTLGTIIDGLHLLSVTLWSGALAAFASVLRTTRPAGPALRKVADRFSTLALSCVVVATLTGTVMVVQLLGMPDRWLAAAETRYGIALGFKIFLAVVMMAFGAANRLIHVANLRRRTGFDRAEFAANVRRESIVAAAVFLIAGIATNLSPAAAAPEGAAPFTVELQGTEHVFSLVVDPVPAAGNSSTFRVTVREKAGALVDDAVRVRITLEPPDTSLAPVQFLLNHVGNGTYERTGSLLFASGRWNGVVFVQTPRTFADSAEFSLDVG